MLRVIACITQQHDPRLVALTVLICLIASYTAMGMICRAGDTKGDNHRLWLATAAAVTGMEIWATHFVAMTAFSPGLPHGFDIGLTALSVVIAIAAAFVGLTLAVSDRSNGTRHYAARHYAGGGLLGLGIGGMHFVGMAALRIPAHLSYDLGLAAAAVIIGVGFSALAIHVMLSARRLRPRLMGAGLLGVAAAGTHFTAMGAAVLIPDPAIDMPTDMLSPGALGLIVASVSVTTFALGLIGVAVDRKLSLQASRQAARFRALASAALEGIVIHADGIILDVNDAFARLVGASHDQLTGKPLLEVVAEEYHELILAPEVFASGELVQIYLTGRNGSRHPVEIRGDVIDYEGRRALVNAVRDISERRQAEEKIRFMAHHDALTDLPNRMLFRDRLTQALARASRGGETVAVLCLDLDRFKSVNDLLGHPAGDNLLRQVGDRIGTAVRDMDTVARLGGDEFAVVQVGASQPEHAAALARRLVTEIAEPFDIDGQDMVIGTSIGIALYPGDAGTPDDLLKNADTALYRAKSDGRGTYRFFQADMDARLQERRLLERDLRHAIAARKLGINYQPLVDCKSGRPVGFEALVRWNHPQRGHISPVEFIPIAEESGLIIQLGEWVLRTACAEAAGWPDDIRVAVNLSPAQFRHGDLPALVAGVLQEVGLAPERLELEITEGLLIQDSDRAFDVLTALKKIGVRISLDDFGTGYSSLGYLQRFPFDKIKIDQSFIRGLESSRDSMAIVRTVITLGQNLGMTVTAEGIETASQYELLRLEHCHQVQGYYLGRPGPAEQIQSVLSSFDDEAAHAPATAAAAD